MKKLCNFPVLISILLSASLAFASGKIQNEDIKSAAELVTAGSDASHLPNDNKVWIGSGSINETLYDSIADQKLERTLTTSQRNAIASPYTGQLIFNSTNNEWEAWNGSAWIAKGKTPPAGSDTQIQYNSSGSFGASANLTYVDSPTPTLSVRQITSPAATELDLNTPATASGNSPNLYVTTGNAASGNSGDLEIATGTASGTAGRVLIGSEMNMSLGSAHKITGMADPTAAQDAATKNYVDTNAANTTLSNLASPTSINRNLTFLSSFTTPTIATPDAASAESNPLVIKTGSSNASFGPSGSISLTTGNQAANLAGTGTIALTTGNATAVGNDNSGFITLTTGNSNSTASGGGEIDIVTGNNAGSGSSSPIKLVTGTAGGTRGGIIFQNGSEGTAQYWWASTDASGTGNWTQPNYLFTPNSASGDTTAVTVTTGNSTVSGHSGSVNITTGTSVTGAGGTGAVNLTTGNNSANNAGTGFINLVTGTNTFNGNTTPGGIALTTGNLQSTTAATNGIALTTGTNTGTGASGAITLTTGTAGGTRGTIQIKPEMDLMGSTSGYVGQKSPATVSSPYAVTWPAAVASASGQALTSDTSGILSWTSPTVAAVFPQIFISSPITTRSSVVTSTAPTFTTFSNSPTLTFTPNVTGKYRVYAQATFESNSTTNTSIALIANTVGSATVVATDEATLFSASGAGFLHNTLTPQSVFTLNAGTSYSFVIQGAGDIGSPSMYLDGTSAPAFLIAELMNQPFVSAAATTLSTGVSSVTPSFTTVSNSPTLTFTPTVSGTYKVWTEFSGIQTSNMGSVVGRITNSTGGATLLSSSYSAIYTTNTGNMSMSVSPWTVYTLNAGTSYSFNLQIASGNNSTTVYADGSKGNFYIFAELTPESYTSAPAIGQSGNLSSSTYAAFPSGTTTVPTLSITPTVSGIYRIYGNLPFQTGGSTQALQTVIYDTIGNAVLLQQSPAFNQWQNSAVGASSMPVQSFYSLNAGTTYSFTIYGQVSTSNATLNTSIGSVTTAMYADLVQIGDAVGANQFLSNLTSPTAINQNLIFSTGLSTPTFQTGDDSAATKNLLIKSGNSSGAASGNVTINSGTSASGSVTGNLAIQSPNATTANSGTVTLRTGSSSTGTTSGGITIATGDGNFSGTASGGITLSTGNTDNSDIPGTITLTGGNVGLAAQAGSATGGAVSLVGGAGAHNQDNGIGGAVNLTGGAGHFGSGHVGTGGAVNITSGAGQTSGGAGTSGNIVLTTGAGSTRGVVQLKDGSEGTSGAVWTSTDASGSGHWAVPTASTWTKYIVTAASLSAGALTNDIQLFSLPTGSVIHQVIIYPTAAFTGTGITSYTVSVGITGTLAKYASAFQVNSGIASTYFQSSTANNLETIGGAATSIRIAATSVGANLSAASAGSVSVYVLTSSLP